MYFEEREPNFKGVDPLKFRDMNYTLEKRIVHKGYKHGVYPKPGALVTIHLRGVVGPKHKIVVDVMNYQCHLGDYDLVDGLELALLTMKHGETATLLMDSAFAYGIFGFQDCTGAYLAPPYAQMRYIVRLLSIEEEILAKIDDNEILRKRFAFKKARGDFWLKRLEFCKAIHLYKRALEYLLAMDNDIVDIGRRAGLPLTNAGIVNLVMRSKYAVFEAAVNESRVFTTLLRDPCNTHALFHMGKLLKLIGEKDEAYDFLKRVTQLDRRHKDAAAEADAIYFEQLRKEYRKVFNIPSHVPLVKKPKNEDYSIIISLAVALFGLFLIVLANLYDV